MPSNSPTDDSKAGPKAGDLYVVATPIGNRNDITLRALDILGRVDFIAAEDTRHTGRLLAHHKIKGKLMAYHEHNEVRRTPDLVNKLQAGASIALVSNAGTPSVSDPGYRLVNAAIIGGIKVIPIPGVSAVVSALSVAGLPTDAFVFIGFPAKKKAQRLKQLEGLAHESKTIVFYESPHRILAFLREITATMGDRYAVLGREMTKQHEEFIRGHLSAIHSRLKRRSAIKGECTLLVMGCEEDQGVSMATAKNELTLKLTTTNSSLSDLTKELAQKYGLPKNKLYEEALKIKAKARDKQSQS
jgi:16S rRNA (cytidine1402-2'-O)-methyltransferase